MVTTTRDRRKEIGGKKKNRKRTDSNTDIYLMPLSLHYRGGSGERAEKIHGVSGKKNKRSQSVI